MIRNLQQGKALPVYGDGKNIRDHQDWVREVESGDYRTWLEKNYGHRQGNGGGRVLHDLPDKNVLYY
jgi:hypothetical protein